ncbi:MAG TPA: SUMF1/EgtB/PvdO family nonheme iron enzyme, partial [Gemmataceae bacterium]|nr:SUMF1/EgtB/PvdO family nonheme iron enzyme [Gemmataceae bacterium]
REAQSVVAPDGSGGSLGFDFKGNLLTRGPYGAFDLSPNRKTLAEIGPDGLTIQDLIGAKPIRKIRLPGPVLSVAFAPDGRHLATANGNGTVYILNLAGTTEPADKRPDGAAGRLGVPVHLENSIGMKLNLIPDGTFLMGSPEEEKYRLADEGPRHEIAVSRPFYLGAYEVTVGQFKAFVRETGHKTAAEVNGKGATHYKDGSNVVDPECTWRTPGFEQTDDHPVVCVSWNDAVAFCEWLSRKENRMYRLPTEAEWEYACRAGTDTAYFFGDDAGPLDEYAWTGKNASEKSHAVGLLKPNPWGLHDVLGNGWEWCLDAPRPYTPTPATDPRGPTTGDLRAIRGGSFHPQDGASYYRSAFRFPPLNRNDAFANQTFRVVLELK